MDSMFIEACNEVVEEMILAFEEVMKEYIEPIADIGNPEKLVGAPYDDWKDNQFVLGQLARIYGNEEPNPLSELIFRKEIEAVRTLEGEL